MFPELRTSKILLAIILLGVAWPGPRLVVHSHDQLACGPETISEHLLKFHKDCLCEEAVPHGYHMHWVFSGGPDHDRIVFPGECQQVQWYASGPIDEAQPLLLSGTAVTTAMLVGELPKLARHRCQPPTRQAYLRCPSQPRLCVWNC